mmetsp:Transcript_40536/g.96320  ORF Transcript_40536/g.96320 Transcript_40536/m.96320 type:complete len:257 (+) Transcript_40536:126-896(+)
MPNTHGCAQPGTPLGQGAHNGESPAGLRRNRHTACWKLGPAASQSRLCAGGQGAALGHWNGADDWSWTWPRKGRQFGGQRVPQGEGSSSHSQRLWPPSSGGGGSASDAEPRAEETVTQGRPPGTQRTPPSLRPGDCPAQALLPASRARLAYRRPWRRALTSRHGRHGCRPAVSGGQTPPAPPGQRSPRTQARKQLRRSSAKGRNGFCSFIAGMAGWFTSRARASLAACSPPAISLGQNLPGTQGSRAGWPPGGPWP